LITIAEALFGLRRYDEARNWLKEAVKVPKVAEWENEAATRKLASIARLQDASSNASGSKLKESKAWEVLRVFFQNNTDAFQPNYSRTERLGELLTTKSVSATQWQPRPACQEFSSR
jgi:hypothetical protein